MIKLLKIYLFVIGSCPCWLIWWSLFLTEEIREGGVWSPAIDEDDELYPDDSPATSSKPAPCTTSKTKRLLDLRT